MEAQAPRKVQVGTSTFLPEQLGLLELFPFFFCFLRQAFSLAVEPILKLALVDQVGLELTEVYLPLPPKCWN